MFGDWKRSSYVTTRVSTREQNLRPFTWHDNASKRRCTENGSLKLIARGLHRYAAFPEGRDRVTHDVTVTEVVENAFKARDALVSPAMTDIRIIPSDATGNNDATPVGTTS